MDRQRLHHILGVQMAHFAKLDENNVVLEVHVVHNNELLDENGVEQEHKGIDFLINWSNGYLAWKQTSYNGSFRKNYAGIGYTYRADIDAFVPPKPFASWTLNSDAQWEAPVAMPADGKMYSWDESTLNWIESGTGI
jgi:hypothetical protein